MEPLLYVFKEGFVRRESQFETRNAQLGKRQFSIVLSEDRKENLRMKLKFVCEEFVRPKTVTLRFQTNIVAADGHILFKKLFEKQLLEVVQNKSICLEVCKLPNIQISAEFTIVVEIIKWSVN